MTATNTSRSTARAGKLQAGDAIGENNLVDLLAFDTTETGVRVGDLLRNRLDAAERAVAAHAAHAEDAQLAGDDAERAHGDEAARLQREVARLQVAINRADERLATVAAAARQAEARAKVKAAATAAARAEAIVATDYPAACRAVASLLDELRQAQAAVVAARAAAYDAEIGDEVGEDLRLPHERRSHGARWENVVVEEVHRGPSVTDAQGRPVSGGGQRHWGSWTPERPAPAPEVTRRTERRLVEPQFRAPDITEARVILPNPDGGRLIDQGKD